VPYSKEFRTPTMLVDLIVDPAKTGVVDIHVYALTPSGGNLFTPGITAEMSLPSKGIAPIEVPLERAGPSHYRNTSFNIPFAGKWTLVVRAYKTRIDEAAVQTTVNIR